MKTIFLLLFTFLGGCSAKTQDSTAPIMNTIDLKNTIKSQPRTILFVWTSWCGVSDEILQNTYLKHQDSFLKNDMNVILLCGSANQDPIIESINSNKKLKAFYLEGSNTSIPYFNRKNIEKTLNDVFDKKSIEKIFEGNFGIPITFIVDSSLNVIYPNAPQKFSELKHFYFN
ncbi:MAG TPA: hypothetical protein PKX92_14220 [Edaphocola sp.]|nr:hypothetical protein [Edaphocola sp.]